MGNPSPVWWTVGGCSGTVGDRCVESNSEDQGWMKPSTVEHVAGQSAGGAVDCRLPSQVSRGQRQTQRTRPLTQAFRV